MIHTHETLSAMKAEIRILAITYAGCKANHKAAVAECKWSRADLESSQMLSFYTAIRAVGRLYRQFLKENDKAINEMARHYGEA